MAPNSNGIGRPFAGNDRKSVMLRIRMEPAEVDRLDHLAAILGTTRSGAIRAALNQLAATYAPTDDQPTEEVSADDLPEALADLDANT